MRTTKVTRRAVQRATPPVSDFAPLIDSVKAYNDLKNALGGAPKAAQRAGGSVSATVSGQKAINIVGASAKGASNVLKGRDASGARPSQVRPPVKRKK